jgi:hypothetical protein
MRILPHLQKRKIGPLVRYYFVAIASMALLDGYFVRPVIHARHSYDHELNRISFDELEMCKPDHFLNAVGKRAASRIGLKTSRADHALSELEPDTVQVFYSELLLLSVTWYRESMDKVGEGIAW